MVSKLIVLIVIALGVVAIAQMMRLYELSSKLRKTGEHDISSRDNNLNARLMLLFMFILFGGFIWLMLHFGWTGRGDSASAHGAEIDWLLNLNFIIIIAVFFLTNALLFWFAYKYVKTPGVKAFYYPHNNKLEMVWTVIPAAVLAVIIILGLRLWNETTDDSGKDAIVVELFSEQFKWTARYSGADNTLGRFDYKLTNDSNPLGLMTTSTIADAIDNMQNHPSLGMKAMEQKLNDETIMLTPEERSKMETTLHRNEELYRLLVQMQNKYDGSNDAAAMDDIILQGPVERLYLCKDQPYEFKFRAKDVIHSAYFPHFRAQMNTVPGTPTRFKFTPTISTKEMREKLNDPKFEYTLFCNKICGGSHYKMYMTIEVLEKAEYDKLMKAYAEGDEALMITSHKFANLNKKEEAPAVEAAPVAENVEAVEAH